jgi:hypothetical protein
MRRSFMTMAAAAAIAACPAVVPAVAEAHHLENDTSTMACVLVNNVPTLQVHAQYRDFTKYDLPVDVQTQVDNQPIPGGSYQITALNVPSLPDFPDDKVYPLAPGTHDVDYYASWNHGRDSGHFGRTVTCPPPVPPPVLCNGVPVPPGTNCTPPPPTTVVVCNGKQMPPGTPTTGCTPPPKTCASKCHPPRKVCVPGRYRVTVHPKHIDHGQVTFRLIGPHTSHVRWYVDHKRHGRGGHAWEHKSHHGRRWSIYLWVQDVWGSTLWGRHRVTVTFDTPCGHRKLTLKYFNHDPISKEAQRELAQAFRR